MNFNFFSKLKPPPIDFSNLGTDMHSHLIPGIDDGAQNVDQSVALIRKLMDMGISKIITTPHIMIDYYPNTAESIKKGLKTLRHALVKHNINIPVEAAAEYYLDEAFENKLDDGDMITMGKNYLLFEVSYVSYPVNLFDILEKIIARGYKPVLAHPERYPYLSDDIENYHRIKDAGCLFQLNTISLTGYYGKSAQKAAEKLVDHTLVDFIGSDMHHLKHANALKSALHEPYVQKLLTDYELMNRLL